MSALDLVKEIAKYYKLKLDLDDKSATDTDFIAFVQPGPDKTNLEAIDNFMAYGRTGQNNRYWIEDGKLLGICLCDLDQVKDFPFTDRPAMVDVRGLKFVLTGLTKLTLTDKLTKLEQLDLSENKNLSVVNFPLSLPNLNRLEIGDCKLGKANLPVCPELTYLDLARNQLTEVTFREAMPKLVFAELSMNKGLTAIDLPYGFRELKYLYFFKCEGLKRFTLEKSENQLPSLNILDLEGCTLETWPENFQIPDTLEALYLNGNMPEGISREIIGRGDRHNSVNDFRQYMKSERTEYLLECRLILFGNEMVGKSSIRIKLLDRNGILPDKIKGRTPGLTIEKKRYPLLQDLVSRNNVEAVQLLNELNDKEGVRIQSKQFVLNIWDFGGQSRYREIQQLFCSSRSIYLFVTSYDDDKRAKLGNLSPDDIYVGFKYWMTMIRASSYDQNAANKFSPVIFAANMADKGKIDLKQDTNKADFPEIKRYVELSCTNLADPDFNKLPAEILKELRESMPDIFTAKYDKKWIHILEKLRALSATQRYLTYNHYLDVLCKEPGFEIDQQAADIWLETMRKLGVLFVVKQKGLIIIDPDWLKDALVNIIDSFKHANRYKTPLKRSEFVELWEGLLVEDTHTDILLSYMVDAKLCYPDKVESDLYHVPLLLDTTNVLSKTITKMKRTEMRFHFEPMLPAGAVNILMSDFQDDKDAIWRNNILLVREGCYVHVSEDWENNYLNLQIYGSIKPDFFNDIIETVKQFAETYKAAHFLNRLDFKVEGLANGDWTNIATIKHYKDKDFRFLLEDFVEEKEDAPIKNTLPNKPQTMKKILIIHSGHESQADLKIASEYSTIKAKLQSGQVRDEYVFEMETCVKEDELDSKIKKHNPDIIHFSMHGSTDSGLFLLNDRKVIYPWYPESVGHSFKLWSKMLNKKFELVILSACESDLTAMEILSYANQIIATNVNVTESNALAFVRKFYDTFFNGILVEDCLESATNGIVNENKKHYKDNGCHVYNNPNERAYHLINADYKPPVREVVSKSSQENQDWVDVFASRLKDADKYIVDADTHSPSRGLEFTDNGIVISRKLSNITFDPAKLIKLIIKAGGVTTAAAVTGNIFGLMKELGETYLDLREWATFEFGVQESKVLVCLVRLGGRTTLDKLLEAYNTEFHGDKDQPDRFDLLRSLDKLAKAKTLTYLTDGSSIDLIEKVSVSPL
jgi:GTPase SAR1 family protein